MGTSTRIGMRTPTLLMVLAAMGMAAACGPGAGESSTTATSAPTPIATLGSGGVSSPTSVLAPTSDGSSKVDSKPKPPIVSGTAAATPTFPALPTSTIKPDITPISPTPLMAADPTPVAVIPIGLASVFNDLIKPNLEDVLGVSLIVETSGQVIMAAGARTLTLLYSVDGGPLDNADVVSGFTKTVERLGATSNHNRDIGINFEGLQVGDVSMGGTGKFVPGFEFAGIKGLSKSPKISIQAVEEIGHR